MLGQTPAEPYNRNRLINFFTQFSLPDCALGGRKGLGGNVLGSLTLYLQGNEDNSVQTFWLLIAIVGGI